VTVAALTQRVRAAYSQAHGCPVDIHAPSYADAWLRSPLDLRLPLPDIRTWYRDPGLWVPLSCAVAFVTSVHWTGAGSSSAANFAACNGAGGLFFVISAQFGATSPAPSADTGSNSWTSLTARTGSSSGAMQAHYKLAPSANSSHTFTNGSSSFGSMIVLGFSGVSAFDQESGANATALQPGSITPGGSSYLFVTGLGGGTDSGGTAALDLSFTVTDSNPYAPGASYGSYGGYLINAGSSAAKNPTWSGVTAAADAVLMATFSPSGGGGGGITLPELERFIPRAALRGVFH